MSRAPVDESVSSRPRAARALAVLLPLAAAASLVAAVAAPADWGAWRTFALIAPICWCAWLLWGWPLLSMDADAVTVRNTLVTWRIPLDAISSVDGGRTLVLHLRGGAKVQVAGVSGGGVVLDGIRNAAAATESGHVVRNASDAAPYATHSRSEASSWAEMIRGRLPAQPGSRAAPVIRRVNAIVIAVTVGMTALAAFGILFL